MMHYVADRHVTDPLLFYGAHISRKEMEKETNEAQNKAISF